MASRGPTTGEPIGTTPPPKRAHYLISFGIGAITGTVAAFGETLYLPLAIPVLFFDTSLFPVIVATIIAPLVEEPVKPLGLFLLKEEEKLSFSLASWAFLGSLAGLGFGFAENVVYSLSVLEFGVDVSFDLFLLRALLSAPLHGIMTTVTGFGIGLWQKTGNARILLEAFIVAMAIHGSFNLLASLV
jgi:RsiW-degrading membrane proteinase PrsW (M82 family)